MSAVKLSIVLVAGRGRYRILTALGLVAIGAALAAGMTVLSF